MYVYRTMMSAQHSKIFKIYNKGNGIYSGIEKFDRYTSKEFDAEESSKQSILMIIIILAR